MATSYDIKSIAYGNGVYIAAATDRILTSTDGQNWTVSRMTNQTVTVGNQLTRVAYGNGKFIVCGEGYYYSTSNNGSSWTEYLTASYLSSIAYGDNRFILASPAASGIMSIDATTLQRNPISGDTMGELAYYDGAFYGVKSHYVTDSKLYRLEGNAWVEVYNGVHPGIRCLRAVGGRLLIGEIGATLEFVRDSSGTFVNSVIVDGIDGQMVDACDFGGSACVITAEHFCIDGKKIARADGSYVCCCAGSDGAHVVTTGGNGCSWFYPAPYAIKAGSDTSDVIHDIAYGNGVYMAVTSNQILKSLDGVTWTVSMTHPRPNDNSRIAFGDNCFVAVFWNEFYATSDNGATWVYDDSPSAYSNIDYGKGSFLFTCNNASNNFLYNNNSGSWTMISSTKKLFDVAYGHAGFVGIDDHSASSSATAYLSKNGTTWTTYNQITPFGEYYDRVRYCNGRYFLGCVSKNNYCMVSTNGTSFSRLDIPEGETGFSDICYLHGKYVAIFGIKAYMSEDLEHWYNLDPNASIEYGYYSCCAGEDKVVINMNGLNGPGFRYVEL